MLFFNWTFSGDLSNISFAEMRSQLTGIHKDALIKPAETDGLLKYRHVTTGLN